VTQEIIVGLDIGTTKVCAVVGEVRDQQVDIVGVGTAPTQGGLRKGVVVNIENTVRSIRRAIAPSAPSTPGWPGPTFRGTTVKASSSSRIGK
jgi:cell division ATPase FtsA